MAEVAAIFEKCMRKEPSPINVSKWSAKNWGQWLKASIINQAILNIRSQQFSKGTYEWDYQSELFVRYERVRSKIVQDNIWNLIFS